MASTRYVAGPVDVGRLAAPRSACSTTPSTRPGPRWWGPRVQDVTGDEHEERAILTARRFLTVAQQVTGTVSDHRYRVRRGGSAR